MCRSQLVEEGRKSNKAVGNVNNVKINRGCNEGDFVDQRVGVNSKK